MSSRTSVLRVRVAVDVPVDQGAGDELRVDVLAPARSPAAGVPVVVRIDGCPGWQAGPRWAAMAPYANPYLANGGFVTIAATVRPSSTATWPAQLHDARRVLAWLDRNPLGLPIDTTRVGVWGHSAGAHVAAMLALTEPVGRRQISAVVAISCPADLNDKAWPAAFRPDSPVTQLLGGTARASTAARQAASPTAHVAADGPPFLLVHGTADETVPFSQAERFARTLHGAGVRCELAAIEGGHHNLHSAPDDRYAGAVWMEVAARARSFFEQAWHDRG
ncbi:MAG TPA: alpha/beta hydrolase [Actinopolymorphaceae bacterium]|jgi:acetyl esterase/lipase